MPRALTRKTSALPNKKSILSLNNNSSQNPSQTPTLNQRSNQNLLMQSQVRMYQEQSNFVRKHILKKNREKPQIGDLKHSSKKQSYEINTKSSYRDSRKADYFNTHSTKRSKVRQLDNLGDLHDALIVFSDRSH